MSILGLTLALRAQANTPEVSPSSPKPAPDLSLEDIFNPESNLIFTDTLVQLEGKILKDATHSADSSPSLGVQAQQLVQNVGGRSRKWIAREWERADFDLDQRIDLVNSNFESSSAQSFVRYRQEIRPSRFESEFQDRRDSLQLRVQGNAIGVSGSFELFVVWSRLFRLGDKWKIWRIPRPSRVPIHWQKALEMEPGEVARLQLLFGLNYGRFIDLNEDPDPPTAPFGMSLGASTQVFLDVYRMAGSRVEVRVAGIRAPFQPSVSAGISAWNPVSVSVDLFIDLISRWFSRTLSGYLRVEPIQLSNTWTLSDELRTDTKVAIYDLDLSTPEGQMGFQRIFQFASLMKILRELAPFNQTNDIGRRLREETKPLDLVHQKYMHLGEEAQRPIIRRVMGDILSRTNSQNLRTNIAGRAIYRGFINNFSSDSNVTVVDPFNQSTTYKFLTGQRNMEWRAALSLRGDNDLRAFNALFRAHPDSKTHFVPEQLSDVIFRREFSAKNMTRSQIEHFKRYFRMLHPMWGDQIPWTHFQGTDSKDRGNVIFEYVFHEKSLVDLPVLSPQEVHAKIRMLLARLGDTEGLLTSLSPLEKQGLEPLQDLQLYPDEVSPVHNIYVRNYPALMKRLQFDRFERDIRFISNQVSRLMEGRKMLGQINRDDLAGRRLIYENSFKALEALKDNALFFELGPALWLELLPAQDPKKYVKFSIFTSHADAPAGVRPFRCGFEDMTDLYRSVQSQMVFLQNRDFDNLTRLRAILSSKLQSLPNSSPLMPGKFIECL